MSVFYVIFEVASIITFVVVNNKLTPESKEIQKYQLNFSKGGCGQMDMTYAL